MLRDKLVFLTEFFRKQKEIGSLIPSSDFLADKLSEIITPHSRSLEVMEVGPGTGSTSVAIRKRLTKNDHLTLVEPNASFCKVLEERAQEWRETIPNCPKVTIFNGYLQDFYSEKKFDHVICGLPLNNFQVTHVKELFLKFKSLLKKDGCFSYFEYMGVRKWNAILMPHPRRKRFHDLNSYLYKEIHPFVHRKETIWLNLFPALIWHIYFHQKPKA